MMRKNNEELTQFTYEQIAEKVDGWRRDLFGLRLNSASSHVKDISQFKKLRRNIARGLTVMQEKKMIAIMQMINEMLQKNIQEEQV